MRSSILKYHGTKDVQHKLPDEILYSVFADLSISDLARCCAVSKRWNAIASDDLLWKNLDLAIEKISPKTGVDPSHQIIREVSYHFLSGSFTASAEAGIQAGTQYHEGYEQDYVDPFEEELRLEELLGSNQSSLIQRIRSAKNISFHSNNKGGIVSPVDILACLDVLGQAEKATHLSFEGISLKRHSFDVAALLIKMHSLTSLSLRQTLVSSYAIVSFNRLSGLRYLDLSYTDVGDFGLETISRHGSNLRQLKLDAVYKVTRDGLMEFFNTWAPKNLELLSLNYVYYLPPSGLIRWAKKISDQTGKPKSKRNTGTGTGTEAEAALDESTRGNYSLELNIKGCECFTMQDIEQIERTLSACRINHTTLLECHSLDAYRRFIDRISHGRLISKLEDEDFV